MEKHLSFRLMLFHLGMEILYACTHVCMDKLGFRPNLFCREKKNGHVYQRCTHMYDTTKIKCLNIIEFKGQSVSPQ